MGSIPRWCAMLILVPTFIFLPELANAATTPTSPCLNLPESRQYIFETGENKPNFNKILHPNEAFLFKLGSHPDLGRIDWYQNGELKQSGVDDWFCFVPTLAQSTQFEIFFSQFDPNVIFTVPIESYKNIMLLDAIPNPVGSDSKTEQIALSNNNPYPVTLKDWQLRSRTSSSFIPITTSIQPQSSVVITSSNKLLNSTGFYDLYNESNQIVDTLNYKNPHEGSLLTRDGIFWDDGSIATTSTKTTTKNSDEVISLTGVVALPQGRTIDIKTNEGQSVHIVIHTSWQGTKPKLHKGDVISVTGIWRQSSRGPYISIRQGHSFMLLAAAGEKNKVKTASVPTNQSNSSLGIQSAVVDTTRHMEQLTSVVSKPISVQSTVWLDGLFGFMIATGITLSISSRSKLFSK
jgi:hypothetical protein